MKELQRGGMSSIGRPLAMLAERLEFITSVDLVQSQDNNSAIGWIAKCL